jgi:hypothetical protein
MNDSSERQVLRLLRPNMREVGAESKSDPLGELALLAGIKFVTNDRRRV